MFVVLDPDESCRVSSDLGSLGDDTPYQLAAERDVFGLQDGQLGIGDVGKPWSVRMGKDDENLVQACCRGRIDRGDPATGDGRCNGWTYTGSATTCSYA